MLSFDDIQRLANEKWGAGGTISLRLKGVAQELVHDQTGNSVTVSLTRKEVEMSEAEFTREIIVPQLDFLREMVKRVE